MEAGFIALLILVAIVGVTVGLFIGKTLTKRRYIRDTQYTQGTLYVDCSDPEFKPNVFLGLAVPVSEIIPRKYVALDINVMLQDSRK